MTAPQPILTTDPTKLVRELHATTLAIIQAKERGDVATVRALRDHFIAVSNAYKLTGGAGDLTALDRFILTTGQYVADAAHAGATIAKDGAALIGATAGAVTKPLIPVLWPVVLGLVVVALLVFSPEVKTFTARARQ
jgi:hypothetical protein